MRIEQLYYFMAVVQTGSFSKAADVVLLKQQSVREAINSLEEELGVKLLHRTSHGVSLTAEGQDCLEDFEEILKIHQRIQKKTKQSQNKKQQISIGINALVGQQIQDVLDLLCDSMPEYDLHFVGYTLGSDVLQSIIQHKCELGITTVTELVLKRDEYVNEFLNHDIMFNTIKKLQFGVYVKQGHPLCFRKTVDLEELKKWQLSTPSKAIITEYLNMIMKDAIMDVMISSVPQIHVHHMERNEGVVIAPEGIDWGNHAIFIPFSCQKDLKVGILYTRSFTEDRERLEILRRLALALSRE